MLKPDADRTAAHGAAALVVVQNWIDDLRGRVQAR
jgi:hypothetical protein